MENDNSAGIETVVEPTKIQYETPEIVTLGSFEDLTKANSVGQHTDAAFAAGTPLDAITTFS